MSYKNICFINLKIGKSYRKTQYNKSELQQLISKYLQKSSFFSSSFFIVFILVVKISSKKVCEKIENNSTLKRVLLVWLVGAIFDSKVVLIILKSLQKKSLPFFVLLELSNINWKCSENYNMLTERTWQCCILKFFSIL